MLDGSTAQLSTGNDHDGSPGWEQTAAGLIRIPCPYRRRWVAPAPAPARIFNCAARSRAPSFLPRRTRASRASQAGSWRLVGAVRGGKVGRESRGSGKGSRPRVVPPPRSSPRRFPRLRRFSGGGWRHVRLDGVKCDAPSVGFLLSRIRQVPDVAAHLG